EDWLRYGVTARRTRNQRRLAELHALRRRRREYRVATATAQLDAAPADLSGRLVAGAGSICKAYGEQVGGGNCPLSLLRRTPVGVLSGGERARLTLARAFARPSNLLILDEPTNDLDLETLDLLQEKLADYAGTVLLVSHDRDFLDRAVTSVVASQGNGRWIEYAGGYTDMLAQR